ncbi:NAD-dependent epimerase/dehydratase [Hypoxylon sp. NC1633]|nr:NAD-dependent epimerase/dehydratase [Hypoxylon sp. NC1633]
MPSALIFGGSGKLAKLITERLVQKGYQVLSVIRREEHIPSLRELGATPILQSIELASVSELASTIRTSAPDTVIFAAGAGIRSFEDRNLSRVVDGDAAIRVFDAMVEAGATKRLIIISTIDARNREKAAPSWYNEVDQKGSDDLWRVLPIYMKAKYDADKDLVEGNGKRGLEYTIIRPTWYGDGEGTGKIKAGLAGFEPKVSREDVADVFVACVENSATVGCVFEISGGEVPIQDAVKKVAEEKIDSFGEMLR